MNSFKKIILISAFVFIVFEVLSVINLYNYYAIPRYIISVIIWASILFLLGYNRKSFNSEIKSYNTVETNYWPALTILFIGMTILIDITHIFEYGYIDFVETYSKIGIPGILYINIFTSLFCAPIFEELFYRHYIYNKLKGYHNNRTILVISSIIFAFSHISINNFDFSQALFSLIPGFFFGWLYIYKKVGIRKIIFIHFWYNMLTYIYAVIIFVGLKFFIDRYDYRVLIGLFALALILFIFNLSKILNTFKTNA